MRGWKPQLKDLCTQEETGRTYRFMKNLVLPLLSILVFYSHLNETLSLSFFYIYILKFKSILVVTQLGSSMGLTGLFPCFLRCQLCSCPGTGPTLSLPSMHRPHCKAGEAACLLQGCHGDLSLSPNLDHISCRGLSIKLIESEEAARSTACHKATQLTALGLNFHTDHGYLSSRGKSFIRP